MTFKLSNPIRVFDLDDFLPSDGESRCALNFTDGTLAVDVFYEKEDSAEELVRTLYFRVARSFFKAPFPGYSFFQCEEDRNTSLLNSVVQYGYSDYAALESENGGYRHYRLFLHSAEVTIHVIAKSFAIADVVALDLESKSAPFFTELAKQNREKFGLQNDQLVPRIPGRLPQKK